MGLTRRKENRAPTAAIAAVTPPYGPAPLTVQFSAGADIWYAADELYCVYQPLNGDGELIARLSSLSTQHMWTKAG